MDNQTIPIFFAVDNSYIPFLAVTLQSLIDNSSINHFYDIKILYTKLSYENQNSIKNRYGCKNIKIEFVDLNRYLFNYDDKFYTRDYYSKTTYFRIFIPDLYPEYDKAIYLDSDMVILTDIAKLYDIDIKNNLLGVVSDGTVATTPQFQEYVEKVVGMSSYKYYFNAGMLLMNLDELRNFRFQEKFLYLLDTMKFTVAQDQDYLNRICKGRTRMLDSSWNTTTFGIKKGINNNPNLIHYNLYFWYYAKKTDYYNEILKIKEDHTDKEINNNFMGGKKLIDLAVKESSCVGDDRLRTTR